MLYLKVLEFIKIVLTNFNKKLVHESLFDNYNSIPVEHESRFYEQTRKQIRLFDVTCSYD